MRVSSVTGRPHSSSWYATFSGAETDQPHRRRPSAPRTTATSDQSVTSLDAVELEHADRVAAQDLVALLVGDAFEHLLAVLLRVRPRRVGVRVVGLEADVVLTDLCERPHTMAVPREAAEH